jgi:hypothetical protein
VADNYGDLPTLKDQLGIEAADDSRDALLNKALAAASRGIDRATGRRPGGFSLDASVVARTYRLDDRIVCGLDGELLLVDEIGDTTGMTVESGSSGSFAAVTGYETSPENALADAQPVNGLRLVSSSWGTAITRVRVTAKFGWPAVPDDVGEAAIIQASRLFKRKDSPEGVMGSAEWGVVRLSRRDPDVWSLIEPYVLPGFG